MRLRREPKKRGVHGDVPIGLVILCHRGPAAQDDRSSSLCIPGPCWADAVSTSPDIERGSRGNCGAPAGLRRTPPSSFPFLRWKFHLKIGKKWKFPGIKWNAERTNGTKKNDGIARQQAAIGPRGVSARVFSSSFGGQHASQAGRGERGWPCRHRSQQVARLVQGAVFPMLVVALSPRFGDTRRQLGTVVGSYHD
jgi:hypothetical protein